MTTTEVVIVVVIVASALMIIGYLIGCEMTLSTMERVSNSAKERRSL